MFLLCPVPASECSQAAPCQAVIPASCTHVRAFTKLLTTVCTCCKETRSNFASVRSHENLCHSTASDGLPSAEKAACDNLHLSAAAAERRSAPAQIGHRGLTGACARVHFNRSARVLGAS
jgi:hypothetical protein